MSFLKSEPAAFGALVTIVATMIIGLLNGLTWQAVVTSGVEALVAWFVRQNVTPVASAPSPTPPSGPAA